MKFFNLDLHATVIKDLIDTFELLGHSTDHWSISAHSWVHGWTAKDVDVVNQFTWKHLNENMCRRFYNRYKDELGVYDGFIVTHTPAFALLYREFNKPIITVASTRYEAPFTMSKKNWDWLNSNMQELSQQRLICRVANNKYDQQYCELFTGLPWTHIPSYCRHVNTQWQPASPSFLVDSKRFPIHLKNVNLVPKKSLGCFSWTDLSKYAGIIVIPYNASLMSVFEYYTACIPLFFPSKKCSLELYRQYPDLGAFSELSWLQVSGISGHAGLQMAHDDPNNYDNPEVLERWISYCDWLDPEWMPYITYFDSFADLEEKLQSADLESISEKMRQHNILRKQKIETLWRQQLHTLMGKDGI